MEYVAFYQSFQKESKYQFLISYVNENKIRDNIQYWERIKEISSVYYQPIYFYPLDL
jgi:adenosine deaminase